MYIYAHEWIDCEIFGFKQYRPFEVLLWIIQPQPVTHFSPAIAGTVLLNVMLHLCTLVSNLKIVN